LMSPRLVVRIRAWPEGGKPSAGDLGLRVMIIAYVWALMFLACGTAASCVLRRRRGCWSVSVVVTDAAGQ
jgi:hypothetical protein